MSTCKGCGAKILWIKTKKGRSMPCDSKRHQVFSGGKKIFVLESGEVVSGTDVQEEGKDYLGFGYVSHFSTCPAAQSFKNSNKTKGETNDNG